VPPSKVKIKSEFSPRSVMMKADGVTATLDLALQASGLDRAKPADRPQLLSNDGSSYIAGDLPKWLDARNIKHLRGAPYDPMTQGKDRALAPDAQNRILLVHYFLPGDLEAQIVAFLADYNNRRYHESTDNLTRPTSSGHRSESTAAHAELS
jgi:RNA-directed DNA polymerase